MVEGDAAWDRHAQWARTARRCRRYLLSRSAEHWAFFAAGFLLAVLIA